MKDGPGSVGHRILVIGMMGSGKSTFARALGATTGLPVIHLDVHYWDPGWVRPTDHEWRERQRLLLAGESWIVDGNYAETLDLQLGRADTVVLLATPWWLCASRALVRGLRKPEGQMPEGCTYSFSQRLRDEWGGVPGIWRGRHAEVDQALAAVSHHEPALAAHVLRSRRESRALLDAINN